MSWSMLLTQLLVCCTSPALLPNQRLQIGAGLSGSSESQAVCLEMP